MYIYVFINVSASRWKPLLLFIKIISILSITSLFTFFYADIFTVYVLILDYSLLDVTHFKIHRRILACYYQYQLSDQRKRKSVEKRYYKTILLDYITIYMINYVYIINQFKLVFLQNTAIKKNNSYCQGGKRISRFFLKKNCHEGIEIIFQSTTRSPDISEGSYYSHLPPMIMSSIYVIYKSYYV